MSRSYSKKCYERALRDKDYDEEYIKNIGFIKTTVERERALCKKYAAKSSPGYRSAPREFVQKNINRPYRRECDAIAKKICDGTIDVDAATFPLPLKTALWDWL